MDSDYSARPMLESVESVRPDPGIAYAALARRVSAADAILRSGAGIGKVISMISEEISGAMQVVLEYENAYAIIKSASAENETHQSEPTPQELNAGFRIFAEQWFRNGCKPPSEGAT